MATVKESIDACRRVHVTQADSRTDTFRRAVGRHAAPDTGSEWDPSDEARLDGEFNLEPTSGAAGTD
jgi:hypothetical protein